MNSRVYSLIALVIAILIKPIPPGLLLITPKKQAELVYTQRVKLPK